jgi:hypothetical protein
VIVQAVTGLLGERSRDGHERDPAVTISPASWDKVCVRVSLYAVMRSAARAGGCPSTQVVVRAIAGGASTRYIPAGGNPAAGGPHKLDGGGGASHLGSGSDPDIYPPHT